MRINSITNGMNFQGTVKYSETLDECLRRSKDRDLKKFEKTVRMMQSVNDGWEYSLDVRDSMDKETLKTTRSLILFSNSLGVASFRTIGEETVRYLDRFEGKCYDKALKKMVSLIESDYKQADSYNSRKGLESRIYDLLGVKIS